MDTDQLKLLAYEAVDKYLATQATGKSLSYFNLQLKPNSWEVKYAKSLLDDYGLVTARTYTDSSYTDITDVGIQVVKLGGIQKYLEALTNKSDDQSKYQEEKKKLEMELLRYQNTNKDLDRDLKIAQAQQTELEIRALKGKRRWAVYGAIGGAILALLVEFIKSKLFK